MKVGILGAGQLGRMLALAGYPLGLEFRFLDTQSDSPAAQLGEMTVGKFSDRALLKKFAKGLDVVTYEFENVPVETARFLSEYVSVYPSPIALEKSQDRLIEKTFLNSLKIPTPNFFPVDSLESLQTAVELNGLPSILKTRRMGYDGKGQFFIKSKSDITNAWKSLGGQSLILEEKINFDREVSLIAVRGKNGKVFSYPLVQNFHEHGILRKSLSPAPKTKRSVQKLAENYVEKILKRLNYVGVLAVEFFQVGDKLIANEMAPRVHNSGHWTIEGATVSQFESHLRAICGLPLIQPRVPNFVQMINIIGSLPDVFGVLKKNGAHLHLYGKQPKPGRKLGHITIL